MRECIKVVLTFLSNPFVVAALNVPIQVLLANVTRNSA